VIVCRFTCSNKVSWAVRRAIVSIMSTIWVYILLQVWRIVRNKLLNEYRPGFWRLGPHKI
jgi:hypothetical protein